MKRHIPPLTAALALLLGLGGTSFAAIGTPPAPKVHSEGGVPYITGGVGHWERGTIESMAEDYNLRLVFSEKPSGAYLADVDVVIRNSAGAPVLRAKSDGPWFFAKLPAGRYRVEVSDFGRTYHRVVDVIAGRQTAAYFSWHAVS